MGTKMIKATLSLLLALCCSQAFATDGTLIKEQITICVDKAGTLANRIGDGKKELITNLKLTGNLNGCDIDLIREMAGGGITEHGSNGKLEILDMSEATIVEGGAYCFYDTETKNAVSEYSWNNVVGTHMFSGCGSLVSVVLPKNIMAVKDFAFAKCDRLKDLRLGDEIREIGKCAFADCAAIEAVVIPASVVCIGDSAFFGCSGLRAVYCNSARMPLLGKDVFFGVDKNKCCLYVPHGTYRDYWISSWGDNIQNIKEGRDAINQGRTK